MKKIKELWQSLFPSKEEIAKENARKWARIEDNDGCICLFVDGTPLFFITDEDDVVCRMLTKEHIMELLESFRRTRVKYELNGSSIL